MLYRCVLRSPYSPGKLTIGKVTYGKRILLVILLYHVIFERKTFIDFYITNLFFDTSKTHTHCLFLYMIIVPSIIVHVVKTILWCSTFWLVAILPQVFVTLVVFVCLWPTKFYPYLKRHINVYFTIKTLYFSWQYLGKHFIEYRYVGTIIKK